eukprot:TRINITY_DN28447_c0_g1_i1.p1 TRINITY_DN28447_c0_g1~~TRINITY_DN28447_c0_g1_i1.p1  ORF type:complete len:162 (+),score=12.45 TRINITY_DN28447_c0_g1_i1:65-487(+)
MVPLSSVGEAAALVDELFVGACRRGERPDLFLLTAEVPCAAVQEATDPCTLPCDLDSDFRVALSRPRRPRRQSASGGCRSSSQTAAAWRLPVTCRASTPSDEARLQERARKAGRHVSVVAGLSGMVCHVVTKVGTHGGSL